MKYLTKDEVQRLLVCINNRRDKLLIQMGFVLGCRVSEIVNIRTKDISPDRIRLWDKKKDCYREAVIDADTRIALAEYLRDEWSPKPHYPHKLFYFTEKTANRIIKHWFKIAGIPDEKAHWHTLRHTYVVQSFDAGVPLNHICEQTGDSPNTVVRIYGRPSIDSRKEMLDARGAYWKA